MVEDEIRALVDKAASWQKAKRIFERLATCNLEDKRRLVYPRVIEWTAALVCGKRDGGYAIKTYLEFLLGEQGVEPDLFAQLFGALPSEITSTDYHFQQTLIASREARAVPGLLTSSFNDQDWQTVVIALDPVDQVELLRKPLQQRNALIAMGFYLGKSASEHLKQKSGYVTQTALGLALIGDPNDLDWFKKLPRRDNFYGAKRIHAALAKPKLGDRRAAIKMITKWLSKGTPLLSLRLCLCRLLSDSDPSIVEAAADGLRAYSRIGKRGDLNHHSVFLRMASVAIKNGVTTKARKDLEAVQSTIARSQPLKDGPTVTALKVRKIAKRAPRKKTAEKVPPVLPTKDRVAEKKLLASVLETPDDDGPRLVYADWLIEHGDPRGEFIQIQCALGRTIRGAGHFVDDNANPDEKYKALAGREKTLYQQNRIEWMKSIQPSIRAYQWHRGFVSHIKSNPKFFGIASEVFSKHPLGSLELGGLSAKTLVTLAETPLPRLKRLHLGQQRITAEQLRVLLEAPFFEHLEFINLWGNPFGEEGANVLAENLPSNLRSISLVHCWIGDAGLIRLLEGVPTNLETIHVTRNDVSLSEAEIAALPNGERVRLR